MAESDSLTLPVPTAVEQQAARERYALAVRLSKQGHAADAVHLIRECCRLDSTNLTYRQALRCAERLALKNGTGWLGKATLKTKRKMARLANSHLAVLEYGEALLAHDPADGACQLEMADAAMALALPELALWILQEARQQQSSDAVNLALAAVFEHLGQFHKAVALLRQIPTTSKNHSDLQRRITALMANDSIRRTVEAQPRDPDSSQVDTGKLPVAELTDLNAAAMPAPAGRSAGDDERIRGRIGADPANVANYLALAARLRRAGRLDECRDALRDGLAATANHLELTLALEELEIERKRLVVADLEKRLKANPADAASASARNAALQDITRCELAYYQRKLEQSPADAASRYELAVRLYRAEQYPDAIRELQLTRDLPRYHWQSLAYLGLSFEKLQVLPLAQRNFKEALQKLPADEQDWRKRILFHLAEGAAAGGDFAEAVQMGYELANLQFTYRGIDRLLGEWQKRLAAAKADSAT